ncbi:MAG: TonB-dependent receptor [Candidatus Pseudobacter hemicellulosilyticus]|uniref:TonB-dependent receptor n=1 Tax=Candidatus Pseudobacter hemicellulosilyticus TaxID=3121375 RepID=A0AAJ5WXF8_9BACT|nr:MAG: TonB-dependent receptor [Pseudobacter sp.]
MVKFTALLLLAACMQVSANVTAQKITISEKDADLQRIFKTIRKQTGTAFFFDEQWLRDTEKVTINMRNASLEAVLDSCFRHQPLTYSIVGSTVVLKKKERMEEPGMLTLYKTIKGLVADEQDQPLTGVSVMVRGTTKGTSTNGAGEFSIDANPGDVLVFSMIGYKEATATVGAGTNVNIRLSVLATEGSQIVVVGYGAMKKSDLSAAVSTVPDMQQIKNRPVLNVAGMIQGKVAGVTAISNGGHPNSSPTITIRGTGSRSSENVLFVVDGVPNAPFNPSDVESIVILKDAASAAIYGAFTGAAGVILVTTRQAAKGNPGVTYEGFVGAKTAWRLPQSLTAEDEAKVANLARTNAGMQLQSGWDASLNPYAQVTRTDWMDQIFRTGMIQRHTVSLNAGTDKFSTLLQARYEEEEGTLVNTYAKNLSLRFNAHYKLNDHVKLRQELFWNNNDNRGTETSSGYSGTILSAIYMPRSATPYYDDGTFGGTGPRDSDYLGIHGDAINPLATLLRNNPYNKTGDIQSVSEITISQLLPGLSFISRFSYRTNNGLYKNFEPKRTEPGKPNTMNTLSYSSSKYYQWFWENTLNYNKVLGRHNISAMASMTGQESSSRSFSATARSFENESDWAQFFVNAGIFDQDKASDNQWKDRSASYVGRLSYSWADRYFLTGSYRYDMAGRLASSTRGQGFPGVTAAWKLSSEPFFDVQSINLLKVRASWGRIGNLGSIGVNYAYPKLASNHTYQVGEGGPNTPALYIDSRHNPDLAWESSEQTDIGLDVTVLNNKLNFTADYFKKRTFNLIKQQDNEWTATFGYNPPYINQGEIRNTGLELSATWSDRIGEVSYQVGANIATLKNKVHYIDDNPKSAWTDGATWRGVMSPYRSVVGQPIYSFWLIQTDGIFQTDQEAQAYTGKNGSRIQPDAHAGDLKFVDADGDGNIDDDDRVFMGSAFPDLTYGFTANLTWKNFDLSIFLQGVSGVKLFHAFKQTTLNGAEQGYNRWNKILDAWSPENPNSTIPLIRANDPNKNFQRPSDWFLENGNYMRIKNILVGYTFNHIKWTNGLRVYISADNLLTITKYSGMDPEVGGIGFDGGQFPVSRVVAIGAKLNF